MRLWSWSKGAIRVNNGDGFEALFDFEDYWDAHGDAATQEIAEFIVDACNAAEEARAVQAMDDESYARAEAYRRERGWTNADLGRKNAQATLDALHRSPGAQVLP